MKMNTRCIILASLTLVLGIIGAGYSTLIYDVVLSSDMDSTVKVEKSPEPNEEYDTENRGQLHPFNPGRWNPPYIQINGRFYDKDPRRNNQFTNQWYWQDAINKGGRLMTYNEAKEWLRVWGCSNIGGSADMIYDRGNGDIWYTDQPCCSCNYDLQENAALIH